LKAYGYSLHKRGNAPEECEDAYSVDLPRGRFAVADGASESCFAKEWAEILVSANPQSTVRDRLDWHEWLPALQQQWLQIASAEPLPWYVERKIQDGAFSTFLSLVVADTCWRSTAVGDTCLFHVRAEQLLSSFPMHYADEFNVHPLMVGSNNRYAPCHDEIGRHCTGSFANGDYFILATDALAEWIMRRHEAGAQPCSRLLSLIEMPVNSFETFIEAIRQERQIRNDDVTLLIVET